MSFPPRPNLRVWPGPNQKLMPPVFLFGYAFWKGVLTDLEWDFGAPTQSVACFYTQQPRKSASSEKTPMCMKLATYSEAHLNHVFCFLSPLQFAWSTRGTHKNDTFAPSPINSLKPARLTIRDTNDIVNTILGLTSAVAYVRNLLHLKAGASRSVLAQVCRAVIANTTPMTLPPKLCPPRGELTPTCSKRTDPSNTFL